MNILIVYDSQFGNTKLVAEAVAQGFSKIGDCSTLHVDKLQPADLKGINLLIVGSPTQGFSATARIKNWLDSLPRNSLSGIRAAAFDTRFTEDRIAEVGILSLLVSIFGYAAKPIAKRLKKKGAILDAEPIGYFVADTEGPLLDQELSRAANWASKFSGDNLKE